jgi:hypothetical protein
MLAIALFVATGALACVALKYDQVRLKRRLTADIDALRKRVEAVELQGHKVWARQDRLQAAVTDRGWRDSMMLTSFDWRRPEKF